MNSDPRDLTADAARDVSMHSSPPMDSSPARPAARRRAATIAALSIAALFATVVVRGEPRDPSPQDPRKPAVKEERERGVAKSRKRAAHYLGARFPKTRHLLAHLRVEDPDLYESLIERGQVEMNEREQSVLDFVRDNHPEMYELLMGIEGRAPATYRAALRDLIVDQARLARLEQQDTVLYEAELEAWRAKSRTRLSVARLALSDQPVDGAMEELLRVEEGAERRRIERQIELTEARLAALRRQLADDGDASLQGRSKGRRKRMQQLMERSRGGK